MIIFQFGFLEEPSHDHSYCKICNQVECRVYFTSSVCDDHINENFPIYGIMHVCNLPNEFSNTTNILHLEPAVLTRRLL